MFASLFNSVWKKSSNQWVVFLSPSYFWSSKKKTRGSLFSLLEVFFCVLKTQLATRSCTKIRGFRLTLFRRSQRKTFVPPFHESRGIVMVTVVFALLSQLSLGGGGLARCLDVWAKMVDDLISLEVQPPFFIGWFPNHHYFSRGLSSSKRNHHFLNGGWLPGFSWECKGTPPNVT